MDNGEGFEQQCKVAMAASGVSCDGKSPRRGDPLRVSACIRCIDARLPQESGRGSREPSAIAESSSLYFCISLL